MTFNVRIKEIAESSLNLMINCQQINFNGSQSVVIVKEMRLRLLDRSPQLVNRLNNLASPKIENKIKRYIFNFVN